VSGSSLFSSTGATDDEDERNIFERTNLTRMIKFAELFPDPEIVATLSQQMSWSHFVSILR
jgi:hypothetical protein